jgi:hypothetical protein
MTTKKRPQTKSVRSKFLYTDVTEEEHDAVCAHCREQGISVSQFVSDLLLQEAGSAKKSRRHKNVVLRTEIVLTPEEYDKLQLLTRLHRKASAGDFILETLRPELKLQRVHAPTKTRLLRYYLSDEEHEMVMKRAKESGMSPRNFAALAILKAIGKSSVKRRRE